MERELAEFKAYKRLPVPLASASGNELVFADGHRVLDLYGGHCVNTFGAGDPRLGATLQRQWAELSFATNVVDHAPRREFLAAFAKNLPTARASGGWSVFVTNSGAEANENALKLAFAATGRDAVVCFSGAFHGRTAAAAAVTDTKRPPFPRTPFEVRRVPFGDAAAARAAIDGRVAAVILEPIQSLAGVVAPPPGFLEALRAACDTSGALLIFDEVQTGNGRLGPPWASQHFGVLPDLFTTAKGAASGLPIGITVAQLDVAERSGDGLFGTTFGGGPLVLALAAETARRIADPAFQENVRATSAALRSAASRSPVAAVRGAGLLLGLELEPGFTGTALRDQLLELGLFVGTSDDPRVLRLTPALTLPATAAGRLATALDTIAARAAAGAR